MRTRPGAAALLLWVALASIPHPATAQTAEDDSVAKRSRPDFQPIGIELDDLLGSVGLLDDKTVERKDSGLSSFVVFPSFGISGAYDSNIYLSHQDPVADKRVVYSPAVSISSDWENHLLSVAVNANFTRFQDRSSEDTDDFQAQTSGRLDVLDDLKVSGVGGIARRHESRSAEDDPGSAFKPTVYYDTFLDTTTEYHPDAFLLRVKLNADNQNYLNNGTINNDTRDLTIYSVSARFGYEFTPGTTLFIEPKGDIRRFARKRDTSGLLQDNSSFGALAGITVDTSGVTFLDFGAGVTRRNYDEPSFQSQTNLDFSGRFVWNPTDLISVTGSVGRSTAESSTPGESGVLTTTYSLGLDYAFLDNIIISGGLSHVVGINQQSGRTDLDYTGNVGVKYLVNENWTANLSVVRATRNSNIETNDYESVVATVGLTGKL